MIAAALGSSLEVVGGWVECAVDLLYEELPLFTRDEVLAKLRDRCGAASAMDPSQGGGLNGSFLLKATTVFDDSSPDKLTGGAGQDWFFANVLGAGTLDKITGKNKSDVVTDI